METVTMRDGTRILFKDWGAKDAPPIVFHPPIMLKSNHNPGGLPLEVSMDFANDSLPIMRNSISTSRADRSMASTDPGPR